MKSWKVVGERGNVCIYGGDRWVGSYNGSFEEFNLVLAMIARLPDRGDGLWDSEVLERGQGL